MYHLNLKSKHDVDNDKCHPVKCSCITIGIDHAVLPQVMLESRVKFSWINGFEHFMIKICGLHKSTVATYIITMQDKLKFSRLLKICEFKIENFLPIGYNL